MGSRIRMFEPEVVYNISFGTVDRQFLFSPNHREDNPLLHSSCPANAFDLANDITPVPSTINIIGSSIGRALKANPVWLHACESNSNHLHEEVSADTEHLGNIAKFEQHANSLIARGMNKILEREGHLFSSRYRMEACVSDEPAEQKLFYALTNVVKDGLVEKVSQSPFFSTFKHQAHGEILEYWYIDWEGYWEAGGDRNKQLRPKDFLKWVTVETTPLPAWMDLSENQHRTRIRKGVREIEEEQAEKRRVDKRAVIGVSALFERDPRDRPKNPRKTEGQLAAVAVRNEADPVRGVTQVRPSRRASLRRSQPLCHASTPEESLSYREKWNNFRNEFIKASLDFRNGYWKREFPLGCYRPPTIRLYSNDEL